MTWPAPEAGLVIRYAYLWCREASAGREEGVKDRPCAVVVAVTDKAGGIRVIALPITHSEPMSPEEGMELPRSTALRLGLDGDRSWVVLSECNDFVWPGPDVRPRPGSPIETISYGVIPPVLFHAIQRRFLVLVRQGKMSFVARPD